MWLMSSFKVELQRTWTKNFKPAGTLSVLNTCSNIIVFVLWMLLFILLIFQLSIGQWINLWAQSTINVMKCIWKFHLPRSSQGWFNNKSPNSLEVNPESIILIPTLASILYWLIYWLNQSKNINTCFGKRWRVFSPVPDPDPSRPRPLIQRQRLSPRGL